MSSHKYEVDHETRLRELLEEARLECLRPPPPSTVTSESEEMQAEETLEVLVEEQNIQVEKEESLIDSIEIEEAPAVAAEVFPTPSLRRLIPEQQRRIEEMNRIQVLPEKFITDFHSESIPNILQTPPVEVINTLGVMTGCRRYRSNLGEYWFLDTLANLLRRAQRDQMDTGAQAVLMAWFCQWMKEVQHFDAADRERMIRRFQDNITAAAKFVADHHRLPTPEELGIIYEARDTQDDKAKSKESEARSKESEAKSKMSEGTQGERSGKGKKSDGKKDNKSPGKKNEKSPGKKTKDATSNKNTEDKNDGREAGSTGKDDENTGKLDKGNIDGSPSRKDDGDDKSEKDTKRGVHEFRDENSPAEDTFGCALVDLTNIAHYIYDLFSTDYQYQLVRSVFTHSPEYVQIDAPCQMKVPRRLLDPQQPRKVQDKDSTRTSLVTKKENPKKGDDYAKLLELQEREERSLAEQESKDRAEWLRRSHILPLQLAARDTTHRS